MNILIIHTAFIGDIVLSTALVAKLKKNYPNSKIYFLTTPQGKVILQNNINIEEVIVYDKKDKDRGFIAFIKLIKNLKSKKIDMSLTPHRYLRSTLLSFFSGAKYRVGYDVASLSFVYNKKIKYDKEKHEVEKLLSFVDDKTTRYELEMYPSVENIKKIDGYNLSDKKIVLIAPGSKWFTKKWPKEYFQDLIERLNKYENINIVITGGEEEKEIELKLNQKNLDLRGKISLMDLAELCKRSDVVVTNDSAPVHIASCFPKPKILAIFGPTIEKFGFFPWSKNSKVFEVKNLYCRPCGIHGGKSCPEKHFRCMKEILPEMIEKEILKTINGDKLSQESEL